MKFSFIKKHFISLLNKLQFNNTKMIYLPDYFFNIQINNSENEKVELNCGIYKIKYTLTSDLYPDNTFGLYGWKHSCNHPIEATFYKNDTLIFSKSFTRAPSIVIHGDGKTNDGTFFTFNNKLNLNIYNMNNEFIGTKNFSNDIFVEFKRISDVYAICLYEEQCTSLPTSKLVDLNVFFDINNPGVGRKCEVDFPLTDNYTDICLVPILATNKGFIIKNPNGIKTNYNFTEENLVLYDDVFNNNFDFYNNTSLSYIFDELDLDADTKNVISDAIINGDSDIFYCCGNTLSDEQKININNIIKLNNEMIQQEKNPSNFTFAMIKPDAVQNYSLDKILKTIKKNGFEIIHTVSLTFNEEMCDNFYEEHINKDFYENLRNFMISGESFLMVLKAPNAIKKWRQLIGPTNIAKAKLIAPHTLRAIYGDETNSVKNAFHGSDSETSAARELAFFDKVFKEKQLQV